MFRNLTLSNQTETEVKKGVKIFMLMSFFLHLWRIFLCLQHHFLFIVPLLFHSSSAAKKGMIFHKYCGFFLPLFPPFPSLSPEVFNRFLCSVLNQSWLMPDHQRKIVLLNFSRVKQLYETPSVPHWEWTCIFLYHMGRLIYCPQSKQRDQMGSFVNMRGQSSLCLPRKFESRCWEILCEIPNMP